jgi:hypothetical protein
MVDESYQLSEHVDYIYYTTFSVVYQNKWFFSGVHACVNGTDAFTNFT